MLEELNTSMIANLGEQQAAVKEQFYNEIKNRLEE